MLANFIGVTEDLFLGFGQNCIIFAVTLLLALPLGLLISFGTLSKFKPLKVVLDGIIWVIRGTPLMLQIFVVYYVPGLVFHWSAPQELFAVCVAFTINYACYFSVIYRGGIQGVPRGQYEASQVLGLNRKQTFRRIVLPQVVKRILPPMSNEIITLVKDTSLANVIGLSEIILSAQSFARVSGIIWPLFYSGLFFLLFNGILTLLFGYAERKMSYYR